MKAMVLVSVGLALLLAAARDVMAQSDLQDGLVAHYPFDGNADNNAGPAPDGIVGGAVLTTNRFGRQDSAYAFDGVSSYIEVENTGGVFDLTDSWTLACWAKPFTAATDARDDPLIWKIARISDELYSGDEDTFLLSWGYNWQEGAEGDCFSTGLERALDDEDFNLQSGSHTPVAWHHVVGTYDGEWLRIYVDGDPEGSLHIGPVVAYTGPAPLRIGNIRHSTHIRGPEHIGAFDGVIDDVRVYSRALNANEVEELYEIPEPATLALLALGGTGLLAFRRRRRSMRKHRCNPAITAGAMCLAITILTSVSSREAVAENYLSHPGFEAPATVGNRPHSFGCWGGDDAQVVTATGTVTPPEGSQMLQFLYTSGHGPSSQYEASEVTQLVDLSSFQAAIDADQMRATGDAYFNRVAGDAETDTAFGLYLFAFSGVPADYQPGSSFELARQQGSWVLTDGDPETWEPGSVAMDLPPQTDYLAVMVYAYENVHRDAAGTEFDGHYADVVTLDLIPEPATLALLALGGMVLLRRPRTSLSSGKSCCQTDRRLRGTPLALAAPLWILGTIWAVGAEALAVQQTHWYWQGAGTGGNTSVDPGDPTTLWTTPSNWSLGSVPGGQENDFAYVRPEHAGAIYAESAIAYCLEISGTSADGVFRVTPGVDFNVDCFLVGVGSVPPFTTGGIGRVVQSGGCLTTGTGHIAALGFYGDGRGTYVLEDGELNVGCELMCGREGSGAVVQTGGVHSVPALYLGYASGSDGRYELSGTGELYAGYERIGYGGTATFVQTGGMNIVSGTLLIADNSAGLAGEYALEGGTLAADRLQIGDGIGTFTFSGGTLRTNAVDFELINAGGRLQVGNGTRATAIEGDYVQIDGALEIELSQATHDSLHVAGVVSMTGGELTVLLDDYTPIVGDTFTIVESDTSVAALTPEDVTDGYAVYVEGNDVVLKVIPEPTTLALLALGGLAVVRRRQRL